MLDSATRPRLSVLILYPLPIMAATWKYGRILGHGVIGRLFGMILLRISEREASIILHRIQAALYSSRPFYSIHHRYNAATDWLFAYFFPDNLMGDLLIIFLNRRRPMAFITSSDLCLVLIHRSLRGRLLVWQAAIMVAMALLPGNSLAASPNQSYEVGPGRTYARLSDLVSADVLGPGDTVLVYPNGTASYNDTVIFDTHGTADRRITIRGVRVNGQRPILSSNNNYGIVFKGDHYIFEGFEVTGAVGNQYVIIHRADHILIRDTLIRDCPGTGLLGHDEDAGSLTLDHVEVTNCGNGLYQHPIYMTTGLPGAVFRMQYCYLHNQKGGNGVKSRANRNEIYYNWIEGSYYHELEMIGPDDGTGGSPDSPRHSDVVGNVFIKKQDFATLVRIGGDGTGQSWGRYRFVNNTLVGRSDGAVAIRAFDGLQSIELHNNVFTNANGTGMRIIRDTEATWHNGLRVVAGINNWIQAGSVSAPELIGTIQGTDPQFVNLATGDVRPSTNSPLINVGTSNPASPTGYPFPSPLMLPKQHPPLRTIAPVTVVDARPVVGAIDVGAYEIGIPPLYTNRVYIPIIKR